VPSRGRSSRHRWIGGFGICSVLVDERKTALVQTYCGSGLSGLDCWYGHALWIGDLKLLQRQLTGWISHPAPG